MKLIILDRDGVINHDSDQYIKSPDEWLPIDGSLEAIAKLNHAGFKVGVATNQSGISRGYYSVETLYAMHMKMNTLLKAHGGKVDYLSFCPHSPNDDCTCRKPKPGMLNEIMILAGISASKTIFIGDTISDKQAADNANVGFALVETGKGKRVLADNAFELSCTTIYKNLEAFTTDLLK